MRCLELGIKKIKKVRKKRNKKLTEAEKLIIAWEMFGQISRNYFGR